MTNQSILITALFLIYFHISGLATTNILRLTTGNTLPILSSKCCCDNCGQPISPFFQLPIISYIICGGKCRKCKTKIPIFSLLLEIIIFSGMCILSAIFNFTPIGILTSFIFYELIRIVTVFIKGVRTTHFTKQYFIAVLAMIPFFLSSIFISLIYITI